MEEFFYHTGQTVYLRENNEPHIVQEVFNAEDSPRYRVKNNLVKSDYPPINVKQQWLTLNPEQKFIDCPFRRGDQIYYVKESKKIKVKDIVNKGEQFYIVCDWVIEEECEEMEIGANKFSFRPKEYTRQTHRG